MLRLAAATAGLAQPWACITAALGLRQQLSSKAASEVEAINREMAEVFGVPYAPEGTCLAGPSHSSGSAAAAAEGMPFFSAAAADAGAASTASTAASGQQLQQEVAAELRLSEQRMMAAQEQLRQQMQSLQQAMQQLAQHQSQQLPPLQQQQHQQHHPQQQQQQLSHVDASGRASMVDVAAKASSGRVARASCRVLLGEAAYRAVAANTIAKGDVLRVAQVAGIQGAKATAQLIPLCHNIFISSVDVDLRLDEAAHAVGITATARAAGQTGVEMEALTGAAVAALTVYDMTKAVSKGVRITELRLDFKEGGKSGVWVRERQEE